MKSPTVVIAVDKPLDPRGGGGVGVWVGLLRDGLRSLGHEVIVAGPSGPGVEALAGSTLSERANSLIALCMVTGSEVVVSASSDTARIAAAGLPDHCRHIATVHSAKPSHVARETGRSEHLADAIVGCSPSVTAEIMRQAKDRSRVFCVPNGIVPDDGPATPLEIRPKVITVAGRLEIEQKRMHWLPRVFSEIRRIDDEIEFCVIGDGSLYSYLSAFATDADGFEMVGSLSHDDVLRHLCTMPRMLLSTSSYEGLSLGMLEALASGASVAVSDDQRVTGGAIDSRHAILLDLGRSSYLRSDVAARMARTVCEALNDTSGLASRVERARALVSTAHSLDSMANGYSEVIAAILARPQLRRADRIRRPRYKRRPIEGVVAKATLSWETARTRRRS